MGMKSSKENIPLLTDIAHDLYLYGNLGYDMLKHIAGLYPKSYMYKESDTDILMFRYNGKLVRMILINDIQHLRYPLILIYDSTNRMSWYHVLDDIKNVKDRVILISINDTDRRGSVSLNDIYQLNNIHVSGHIEFGMESSDKRLMDRVLEEYILI